MKKTTLAAIALALNASLASAAGAPALSPDMAQASNALQRAAWACENGAAWFVNSAADHPRFFLGIVDDSAGPRDKPPLTLQRDHLSGFGSVSNQRGWSNIRFDCTLAPGLAQATGFRFDTLSAIPQNSAAPAVVASAAAAGALRWYLDDTAPLALVHGVQETDNRDFRASCSKGAGVITVGLTRTMPALQAGNYVAVSITDGPHSALYVARGVRDDNLGAVLPVFTSAADDPLWGWLAHHADRTSNLAAHINIGGNVAYDVALQGSGAAAKTFAAACHRD